MQIITREDFIDVYVKLKQRGSHFLLSKLTFNKKQKTISAFDTSLAETSNWWIIPMVKERWNQMMTGNPQENFKQYLIKKYIGNRTGLKLLSLGSGTSKHELELATYSQFEEITCVDINQPNLNKAKAEAKAAHLKNIKFICSDINTYEYPLEYFDMVIFNNSLHHFDHVHFLIEQKVKPCLKKRGLLVINEYVGPSRLQFPKEQIQAINNAIKRIDKPYRRRYKTQIYKTNYYGSGLLRMILADPSECIDSAEILPSIHQHFSVLEEKTYGGNLLVGILKDIAHHFVKTDADKEQILYSLFELEDEYLKNHSGDFVFGIYLNE